MKVTYTGSRTNTVRVHERKINKPEINYVKISVIWSGKVDPILCRPVVSGPYRALFAKQRISNT